MTSKIWTPSRRTVVKGLGAAAAVPLAGPFVARALAEDSKPIRYAVVAAQIAAKQDGMFVSGPLLSAKP